MMSTRFIGLRESGAGPASFYRKSTVAIVAAQQIPYFESCGLVRKGHIVVIGILYLAARRAGRQDSKREPGQFLRAAPLPLVDYGSR